MNFYLFLTLAWALVAKVNGKSVRGVKAREDYRHPTQRRAKMGMGMMSGKSMMSYGGYGSYGRSRDDDDDWNGRGRIAEDNWWENISSRTNSNGEGGSGTVEEWYECKPLHEMIGQQFFLDPDITGETGTLRKYDYTPNMCRCDDGCCRMYNWLLCDTSDSLPYIQCICNENTHPIENPVPMQDIVIPIDDPNNTGANPGVVGPSNNDETVTVILHAPNDFDETTNGIDNGSPGVINFGTDAETLIDRTEDTNTGDQFISTGGNFDVVNQSPGGSDTNIDASINFINPEEEDNNFSLTTWVSNAIFKESYNANDCVGGSPFRPLDVMGVFDACIRGEDCGNGNECCLGFFCFCGNPGSSRGKCIPNE